MRTLTCLLLALLVAPTASAGWFDEARAPLDITPAPLRLGDRFLFEMDIAEEVVMAPDVPRELAWYEAPYTGRYSVLVTIEGRDRVPDHHGVLQDSVAFRIERFRGDEVLSVERCHAYPGLAASVRWDWLAGGPRQLTNWGTAESGVPLMGNRTYRVETTPVTTYFEPCDGYYDLSRVAGQEGERVVYLGIGDAPSGFAYVTGATMSEPATPVDFHGRAALEYRFPLRAEHGNSNEALEGQLLVRLADGLPVPVHYELTQTRENDFERRVFHGVMTLAAYEPGNETYPVDAGYRWPERNPAVAWEQRDTFGAADGGLPIPYPFAEMMEAARRDPSIALDRWLAAHPQAGVVHAVYDRDGGASALGGAATRSTFATDGAWMVCLADAEADYCFESVRLRGARTSAGELAGPSGVARNTEWSAGGWGTDVPSGAFDVIAPRDLMRLLASVGVAPESIRGLSYNTGRYDENTAAAWLTVSQISPSAETEDEGLVVEFWLTQGALQQVGAARRQVEATGLMGATAPQGFGGTGSSERLSALGALAGPIPGAGLTAGAATSIAVLVILAKFVLVPLFTRLRRDRLLDNPVRARLYERVRAEPGMHLAEIGDFLGVGRGATRHHVDQLVKNRLLVEIQEEGFTRYFAAGEVPPEVARREGILRAGSHRAVYELYAREATLPLREAAARLGISAPSVHRAKRKLEHAGLLPAAAEARVGLERAP